MSEDGLAAASGTDASLSGFSSSSDDEPALMNPLPGSRRSRSKLSTWLLRPFSWLCLSLCVLIVMNILVLVIISYLAWLHNSSLPQTSGTVTVRAGALSDEVVIERDQNGLLHISGETVADVVFGQGAMVGGDGGGGGRVYLLK